jgi:hypothetical protein
VGAMRGELHSGGGSLACASTPCGGDWLRGGKPGDHSQLSVQSVKVGGAGNVIDILTTAGTARQTQETLRKLWTAVRD